MDVQVQNAIEIAWNPSSEQNLKAQAFEFFDQFRSNPSSWQICLSLFTRSPRPLEVVRHVSLEVVNGALQNAQLEVQNVAYIRDSLMDYVRRVYGLSKDRVENDSGTIQNKLAQTLTFLFTATYETEWTSFFDDLRQLYIDEVEPKTDGSVGTLFYLRVLASVHDEIADVLVQHNTEKQKQYNDLKDFIRLRDASKIAQSWQDILSRWQQQGRNVTEMCLKTMSRWVSWIDITFLANEETLNHLFQIAGHQESDNFRNSNDSTMRDAAIDVFTEIISKKMLPREKVELIRFLNLDRVIDQLISTSSLNNSHGTSTYDTDMAESVAKLVNTVVFDIVNVLDDGSVEERIKEQAEPLLQLFVPHLLRFFTDEYDEVCSTVIPSLTDLLSLCRKIAKQRNTLPGQYADMLPPILNAIVAKMRYDDTSTWGEEDEQTDEAEFADLRKRLKVLQQSIAAIDEALYLESLGSLVESTFSKCKSERRQLDWRDLDLALHEMYSLGELAMRNGGLYQKKRPSTVASGRLIHMMSLMLDYDIASFPHPAVHVQYMEICVRYYSFFEQQMQYIPKVLENFVAFIHETHVKVRMRSWHLFLRFVRSLRLHLGNVAETIIRAMGDLLEVKAEITDEGSSDGMSSDENNQSVDALFQSQLHLFEAVGCLASAPSSSAQTQASLAKSVADGLTRGLQEHLTAALAGDERAVLQIHHLTMALGTLARGVSDWAPGSSSGSPVSEEVSEVFRQPFDSILTALGVLRSSMTVRTAARFAFARMIGVLGFKTLEKLPLWIDGFLTEESTKDEMATFLRLLDQIIFGFKTQIYGILDTLLTPLLQRIFAGFADPTTGTDDEIQLGELRREYLSFLLVILNNELGGVFISPMNQAMFETIISTIEHFAKDSSEHPDAKLAMSVMTRMSAVWGGPDIPNPTTNTTPPSPSLPGFDRFMLTRFSSLTWTLMTSPSFSSKDPHGNRVIGEVAVLQQTILAKTGYEYLTWLRNNELPSLGLQPQAIDAYLTALTRTDAKGFKQFLLQFLQQGRS